MKLYNNAELNEHVQWLIKFMQEHFPNEHFPNGFEIIFNGFEAELNSINTVQVILSPKINTMIQEENEKRNKQEQKMDLDINSILKDSFEKVLREYSDEILSESKKKFEKSSALYAATNEYDDFVGLTD